MRQGNLDAIFQPYKKKKKYTWINVVEAIIFILFLVVGAGFIYEKVSSKADQDKFKIKGRLVDVGDYKIFARNNGEGKTTVVMESDIGDPSSEWTNVVEPLSKNFKVVTYDRAGYGWSEDGTGERSIAVQVKDLHTLLKKNVAKTPYLLVGHGYGGLIMMNYVKEYPDEVSGLILLDTPSEGYMRTDEFQKELDQKIKNTKLYTYSSMFGIVRLADKYNKFGVNTKLMDSLTDENKEFYKTWIVTSKYNKVLYNEFSALKKYEGGVQTPGLLGDKPVYVLSSSFSDYSTDKQAKWMESQKEFQGLSSKTELSVVESSSTYIQIDKPDAIISAVNGIMKKLEK